MNRYWELKQSKRWEEVYDGFLDPEIKSKIARDAFLEKRRLAFDILTFSVASVKEDGDRAVVTMANEAHIPLPAGRGSLRMIRRKVSTEDTWVRRDGRWYVQVEE